MKKNIITGLLILVAVHFVSAQTIDTTAKLSQQDAAMSLTDPAISKSKHSLSAKMILPVMLTTYGFVALGNEDLKEWDVHVKEQVWDRKPHPSHHFDDWLQYMPGFSVYVLNSLGFKGKSTLTDATRKYLISSLSMAIVVQTTKHITALRRPDGFGSNAFPSGHTAVAFVAAEFLNQEYKDRSIIIPVLGYTAAATVGYMRLYNNRHWFKDVVAGAGIGMGITKLVYWYYPRIKQKLWPEKKRTLLPVF